MRCSLIRYFLKQTVPQKGLDIGYLRPVEAEPSFRHDKMLLPSLGFEPATRRAWGEHSTTVLLSRHPLSKLHTNHRNIISSIYYPTHGVLI